MGKKNTHGSVIGVVGGHCSGSFGGQFIELAGGDALVDAGAHLLRHEDRIAVVDAEPVTQLLEAGRDLVEVHGFLTPISLHHIHFLAKSTKLGEVLSEDFRRTGLAHLKRGQKEQLYIEQEACRGRYREREREGERRFEIWN